MWVVLWDYFGVAFEFWSGVTVGICYFVGCLILVGGPAGWICYVGYFGFWLVCDLFGLTGGLFRFSCIVFL